MRARWLLAVAMLISAFGVTARAADELFPSNAQDRRQLFDAARKDPKQYTRLVQNLQAFLSLSPDRQKALRQLDHDLAGMDRTTRARLLRALDRYVRWYDRLSDADRRAIDQAATPQARIRVIKQIRERQWLEHLPKTEREQVENAKGSERQQLIKTLHDEQKKRRQAWQLASRHWDELTHGGSHTHLNKLPPWIKIYVDDFLRPLLSPSEQQQLLRADGSQALLPLLQRLAKKHPVILPGPSKGISRLADLPLAFRQQLLSLRGEAGGLYGRFWQSRRQWPDFAIWTSYLARRQHLMLPKQLGPCKPAQFDFRTQLFIRQLRNRLKPAEEQRLHKAEGNWPLYPRLLDELAAKYDVPIPGGARFHLPGPPDFWNWYQGKQAR